MSAEADPHMPEPVPGDVPSGLAEDMAYTGCHFHRAHPDPIASFQVLGERGSGTNYVRKVLQRNIKVFRTEALGWKHGFPTMIAIPKDMVVVCAVRNAEDWALSMYKRPWHADPAMQELGFSDFLRAEWRSIVDRTSDFDLIHPELQADGMDMQYDRHPVTGKRFENLFALRRAKMDAALGMLNRGCNVTLVKMETVQEAGIEFVGAFRAAYGLDQRWPLVKMPERRMGNNFNPSVKDREDAPKTLSPADRAFMLSQLDLEAEAMLGYSY
jgi:hypothetical protein